MVEGRVVQAGCSCLAKLLSLFYVSVTDTLDPLPQKNGGAEELLVKHGFSSLLRMPLVFILAPMSILYLPLLHQF